MADIIKTEVRLFAFGENPTEKGVFLLTKADAAACLKAWQNRGTDLSWDYEHAVVKDGADNAPAAAWCGLEVRKDGLWATNIRWTSRARQLIEAKEYRYFSPLFEHDDAGHVLNIINVALTNTPATWGIQPLIAASALSVGRGRIARGATQPIPRGRAPQRGRKSLSRSIMDEEEKKAMKAALAEMQEQCKAMAAKLEGEGEGDPEEGQTAASEGDPEEDAKAAAAALCALTGEKSPVSALAKLVKGQGAQETQTHAHRVELAIRDGALPPALKETALSWNEAQLAAYLKTAPKVKTSAGGGTKPPAGGGQVTLSAADKEVAKRFGLTPEKMLEAKIKMGPMGSGKGVLDGALQGEEDSSTQRDAGHPDDLRPAAQGGRGRLLGRRGLHGLQRVRDPRWRGSRAHRPGRGPAVQGQHRRR